ncbi:MAG: SAM-dependent chlorinase/fluorinase [Bacteroidales bacterium]|nr:SAM-dependent chlorinase/fluorinase [Bacteroidales bacterium]
MKTPIVTLTTDWGDQGFFAGMVKGALMRHVEGIQVVDITHRLEPYNTVSASFVVRHGCMGFPEGTVHLIDVASQLPFVALRARGQYYICSDNGLPALVFGDEVEECVSLPTQASGIYNFAAYNLFVPAAVRLLSGTPLSELGTQHTQLLQRPRTGFMQQGEYYRIYVHYIDNYGNAYLGMSYHEFEELRQGRQFVMQVKEMTVGEIGASYQRGGANDMSLRLTVSATGQLELALPNRSLAQLAGLRVNESVLLKFK